MELIDLKRQYELHRQAIDREVSKVLASGRYISGPQVSELEERLAKLAGVEQAVGVGSGTCGLILALMALELKAGDEVICPTFTFFAPAEAVGLLGGRPVLVDVEPVAGTISPEAVEAAITPRTVGVIAVDLFGQCAQLEAIEEITRRHGLWMIEDAAQTFGANRHGRKAGSFGEMGVTSFFPAKPLGCYGEGGMVFTNDPALAAKIQTLKDHGQDGRYSHVLLGLNGRLDTVQAAVLLAKLDFFAEEVELRNKAAEAYDKALAQLDGVETPRLLPGNASVWAQYTIKCSGRDGLAKELKRQGIPTAVHYSRPLHLQPVFEGLGYRAGQMPVAEDLCQRVISLPMHPYLTEEERGQVVAALSAYFSRGEKPL